MNEIKYLPCRGTYAPKPSNRSSQHGRVSCLRIAARRGQARQGEEGPGMVRRGPAGPGIASRGTEWLGLAWLGEHENHGREQWYYFFQERLGMARRGEALRGPAWQGRARLGSVRLGKSTTRHAGGNSVNNL
jgi:hypothetical protein